MAVKEIFALVEEVKQHIENLSVEELKAELSDPDVLIADIREIQERVDLGNHTGRQTRAARHVGVLGGPEKPLLPGMVRRRPAHRAVLRRRRTLGPSR